MARSSALAVAVVGLGAAAALIYLAQPKPKADDGAQKKLEDIARDLDRSIDTTSSGLHSRASTLADLPRLRNAVVTDAATVKDLTGEELMFQPKPGETVEIGQIPKTGAPVSLLKLPADSTAAPPLDKPGTHLGAAPNGIVVSDVVDVTPVTQQTNIDRGVIAITSIVDTGEIVKRLDALDLGARIEWAGATVAMGKRAIPADAKTVVVPLASAAAKGATLVAELRAAGKTGASLPMELGGGAAALIGLVLAAVLWRSRPAAATPTGTASVKPVTGPTNTATGPPVATAAPSSPRVPTAQPGDRKLTGHEKTEFGAAVPEDIPLPKDTGSPAPLRIGRYAVIRTLGSGGMAEVHLARATGEAGFEKLVALKVVHKNLAQRDKAVEHFLDEARLASRLTHPNIVQISDLGRAGDDFYIAMEYVDGKDLENLLMANRDRGTQVPVRVALTILRKICDGLEAAHTAVGADGAPLELVHRDVKSANVLLSKDGAVKIADFGIAKANQQIHKTQMGEVKGTAAYMAPEHRMGEPVDRRADVYGVGAIAYELLTGTEINLDLVKLLQLGVAGWPHLEPLSKLRPELPPELDQVVFKALTYKKEERYPTCAALEEALEEVANKHGLSTSDKLVAQWVDAELKLLAPQGQSNASRLNAGA